MKIAKHLLLAATSALFAVTGARAADHAVLTEPVKSVYAHYLKIQSALAGDSLAGVEENAKAIAQNVQKDAKTLPPEVATEAEAVARARDLKSARAAFKSLSDSLIKYLADHQAQGAYVQVYCPMAQAGWLQIGKDVKNPYYGKEDLTCGEIKN